MRMNHPTLHFTKVYEYTQGFVDEVFKVVHGIGGTHREKAKLRFVKSKMSLKCGLRNGGIWININTNSSIIIKLNKNNTI